MNLLPTIAVAIAYMFFVILGIGAAYSIRDLYRTWRGQLRDGDALNRRMCEREMRRKIGL